MKKTILLLVTLALTGVGLLNAQLNKGSVYYMTKPDNVDGSGVLFDQKVIDDLEAAGFDLTLGYPGEGGAIDAAELDTFDVVIVGRNISSGDFKLADDWATLEVPVMMLSGYIVRNSRLKYVNTGSVKRETNTAVEDNMTRITKALVADEADHAFSGVDITDGKMDYMTWFYDYLSYGADTFATTNNGTLLASIVDADTLRANGNVLMARWEPGVETYAGSGITPASYRTYMQIGGDDSSDPKKINYAQYTPASFQVMVNEISWLIRTYQDVQYFVKSTNVDGNGVLHDQQVIDDLKAAGYKKITTTYTGDGGAINAQELSLSDLVIIGRNVSSGDFKMAEDWAKVEAPVLILSGYIVRNSRLKYMNSGSVKREISEAVDSNMDRVTMAAVADETDVSFSGVEITSGKMGWMTWFYDYLAYGADTFATTNNGKLLASIVDADSAAANGNVLMARWEPGVETYSGSGIVPASYRTYLQSGADDSSDPKKLNYVQYTNASFQVILNEMDYLASTRPGKVGEEISDDATLASLEVSAGTLDPAFSPEVTSYAVELPEGTTDIPTVAAVANHTGATIQQENATGLPGTTVVRVTAQDQATIANYLVNFTVAGGNGEEGLVEPGIGTLDDAVLAAADGDTLVLKNGETYDILDAMNIDKKLVIIAQEIPALPGLENMPKINNMFTATKVFHLQNNANLHLIGIDVDAGGGANIFVTERESVGVTVSLEVNRCRLHNTIDDIMEQAADGNVEETTLDKVWIRNTFIYDTGDGHGIYTKNFQAGSEDWVFENITMWNMGQQFNWIRVFGTGLIQKIVFDHITGYNLSTSSENKELFGNNDGATDDTQAALNIEFKNNILHTQVSDKDALIFQNSGGKHTININNNVMFGVGGIANEGQMTSVSGNLVDVDPQLADPANSDFTVGNTDLYTASDDGKIIGAIYWHPDYVDDFSDIGTAIDDYKFDMGGISVYPNPFAGKVHFNFNVHATSQVSINVYNITGSLVMQVLDQKFVPGSYTQEVNSGALSSGLYIYRIQIGANVATGRIVKTMYTD